MNPKRLGYWLLTLLFVLSLSAYFFENWISYSFDNYSYIRFGHYGFYLAKFSNQTKDKDQKLIAIISNSVYQHLPIAKEMEKIASENGKSYKFLNLAQTGSGLNDFLLHEVKALSLKPDLIVIALENLAFDKAMPRFRTDTFNDLYSLLYLNSLSNSYYQSFTIEQNINFLISQVFRWKRLEPYLRWRSRLFDYFPSWFLSRMDYPLDLLSPGWRILEPQISGPKEVRMRDDTNETLQEMIRMATKEKIPLLIIRQEENWNGKYDPLSSLLLHTKGRAGVGFVDLKDFWKESDFKDSIHPKMELVHDYALRHFTAIDEFIASGPNGF